MSDPIPTVLYAARSKAEEAGKNSVEDQVAHIQERLEREHDPDRFVYDGPFKDHASGYRGNRGPGLESAIAAAERAVAEHGAAELWVWKTNRLGRGTGRPNEARALTELLPELRRKGITVRSVADDEFATNEMLWGFASKMASEYSAQLSSDVKRGLGKRAEKGFRHGTPPYGYASDPEGHWEAIDHEAAVVRRIFEEFTEGGLSSFKIATSFNDEGMKPRKAARWDGRVSGGCCAAATTSAATTTRRSSTPRRSTPPS